MDSGDDHLLRTRDLGGANPDMHIFNDQAVGSIDTQTAGGQQMGSGFSLPLLTFSDITMIAGTGRPADADADGSRALVPRWMKVQRSIARELVKFSTGNLKVIGWQTQITKHRSDDDY